MKKLAFTLLVGASALALGACQSSGNEADSALRDYRFQVPYTMERTARAPEQPAPAQPVIETYASTTNADAVFTKKAAK